jgi:hypothetical protein
VATDPSKPGESDPRILPFRPRGSIFAGRQPSRPAGGQDAGPSPVDDLGKYERGAGDDDYRHRMLMNLLAFGFVVLLVLAGVWMADRIALMRKNQDCVLSGRRGCTPVEVPVRNRY